MTGWIFRGYAVAAAVRNIGCDVHAILIIDIHEGRRRAVFLIQALGRTRRQAHRLVEAVEVRENGRLVTGFVKSDCLPGTVGNGRAEVGNAVYAVGRAICATV